MRVINHPFLAYIKERGGKILLILAFALPVLCLAVFTAFIECQLRSGKTAVLPVEGYDPRDLLSGRYLHYKILYGASCPAGLFQEKIPGKPGFLAKKQKAYLCLRPEIAPRISASIPKNCDLFIKGACLGKDAFYAGGDRLYLPDLKAKNLERMFQQAKKKEVLLLVTKRGRILAKDILIDGKSLKSAQ